MRVFFPIVVLAATTSTALADAVNGSFENEPQAGPGRVFMSSLTDWTSLGGSSLLERGVNEVSAIAAHSGVQFVSMGHNSAQGDTLLQAIAIAPGQVYTVSFFLHCIQGNALQTVQASAFSGVELGGVAGSVSSVTQGWVNFSFEFQATASQTTIRFVHSLAADGANVAIDTVTVIPAPSAGLLIGLAGLLGSRRRR